MPQSRPTFTPEARIVLAILGLLALFRLGFCTTIDLVPDEAYYWLWSKHLAASYFSKGPGVGWTIALGTLVGGDTVLGVRWIAVLLASLTGWQVFRLGERLYGPRVGMWSAIAAASVPLFAVGSFLMTIDPLSVFFWVWAANLFLDALEKDRLRDWALCGLAVGLGFLSKPINPVELIGFLAFGIAVPRHRKAVLGKGGLVLLATFAVCTLPVLLWNQQHGWVTVRHIEHRGDLDRGFHVHPGELGAFLGIQATLLLPPFFLAILWSAGRAIVSRERAHHEAPLYLLCLFLPTFLLYAVVSLNKAAQPNWAVTAYPSALILATAWGLARWPRTTEWTIRAAFALILVVQTALLFPLPGDPLHRLRGWKELGAWVGTTKETAGAAYVIGSNYGLTGELGFYVPGHPPVYMPPTETRANQFSFWPGYGEKEAPGAAALYVTDDFDAPLPESLQRDFPTRSIAGEFNRVTHEGKTIEHYRAWKLER
ncbi:MAG TPA: glycosyltransferase family 39 protein [Candidatus Methylacidiphilales bacterium]